MEYQEYGKKIKKHVRQSTIAQRVVATLLLLIILAIVIVVMNPKKMLLEMRNSQRRSDVVNILNSVYQYSIDHDRQLPFVISSEPSMICRSKALSCSGLVDMSEITTNKKYLLSSVPVDPREQEINYSGYQISKLSSGRISVSAPLAENNAVISLSK